MTHRRRRTCRADGCRARSVMIALVDEQDPMPGEDRARFGVGLCRVHSSMWITYGFGKFKLKPHRPPVTEDSEFEVWSRRAEPDPPQEA